jgi:hypothetical protein
MIDHFRRGVHDLEGIWRTMFDRADLEQLKQAASQSGSGFSIDDRLWTRLVYALAAAYHRRVSERDALVRSTLPLYMGRVASFVMEMADADAGQVETRLEHLCTIFEQEKDYLRRRWSETS